MSLLYSDLAAWYHLLDPVADHEPEAGVYRRTFEAAVPGAKTLLELGAGAGNNAFFLKRAWQCTLTDLAAEMLDLSRRQNPECEHSQGDMLTLRLGRTFDLVLAHDAVTYLTTEAQLRAVAETAFVHLRPGGAALFLPDTVKETFGEVTQLIEGDDGVKALRAIEWSWDPDPSDDQCRVEYVLALREDGVVRTAHDCHFEGLFSRAQWVGALESAGFRVEVSEQVVDEGITVPFFLARRG